MRNVMRHVWNIDITFEEEAKCWCDPFISDTPWHIAGLVFHRALPGYLFWEYGEQGPQPIGVITVEPTFECLDMVGNKFLSYEDVAREFPP